MRDINRIPVFLKKLEECWSKAPDLRFGQFITDFLGFAQIHTQQDIFYIEDDELQEILDIYIENTFK